VEEAYCGPITCLIAFFIFPFVCCCPCDRRQEFYAINGGQQVQYGMQPPQQMQMQPQYGYAQQPQYAQQHTVYGQPAPAYAQQGPATYTNPTPHAPGGKVAGV
jgi:hypothetical protein